MTKPKKGSPVKRADEPNAAPLNVPMKVRERNMMIRVLGSSVHGTQAALVRGLILAEARRKGLENV